MVTAYQHIVLCPRCFKETELRVLAGFEPPPRPEYVVGALYCGQCIGELMIAKAAEE